MYPAFNPSTTDYVSRCNASTPLTVSIGAPSGTAVSVDYRPWQAGIFDDTVPLAQGQDVAVAVLPPSGPETAYYIRCLPSDFPNWSVQQTAASQAAGFVGMVIGTGNPVPTSSHCTVFNSQGVPVWWSPTLFALYCTVLPDGNIGWIFNGNLEEHRLDGSTLTTISPAPVPGGLADGHDLLVLPNGDYVLVADTTRSGVDLSAELGSSYTSTSISDPVIEEFTSSGSLVGSWDTYDHIPVSEWDPQWYGQTTPCPTGSVPTCYDVYHWNSIEYTGSGFMVSYRHLDAVYNIVESTSQLQSSDTIQWKLGSSPGQPTTEVPGESLTVTNDPVFTPSDPSTCTATADPCHFGGQHDARLNSDGTVSLYDDGTGISPARPPRAVRYAIDTTAMTATLEESVTDAAAPPASICCGSARKLVGGDWVIGWGGTNVATENAAADGAETLRLQFDPNVLIYRMVPLTSSQFNLYALRAGMDAQYANSTTAHSETTTKPTALTP